MKKWTCILKNAILGFIHDEAMFIAGTLAFYTLLAIFPFIIFLTALAGIYADTAQAQQAIYDFLHYVPREVAQVLLPVMQEIMRTEGQGILTLGFLGTLWILMTGVEALRTGLNRAYGVDGKRNFFFRQGQNILIVLLLTVGLILTSTAIVLGPVLFEFAFSWYPQAMEWEALWNFIRYVFGFFMMMNLFAAIYYYLPNLSQTWRRVLPGAFIATVLWLGLASLFSLYLANAKDFTVTYGSLSGIIIAMIFFQFSAVIFLFGAEINDAYRQFAAKRVSGNDLESR